MQVEAGVSLDLIAVVQALVIIFIAAPLLMSRLVPWLFPRKAAAEGRAP